MPDFTAAPRKGEFRPGVAAGFIVVIHEPAFAKVLRQQVEPGPTLLGLSSGTTCIIIDNTNHPVYLVKSLSYPMFVDGEEIKGSWYELVGDTLTLMESTRDCANNYPQVTFTPDASQGAAQTPALLSDIILSSGPTIADPTPSQLGVISENTITPYTALAGEIVSQTGMQLEAEIGITLHGAGTYLINIYGVGNIEFTCSASVSLGATFKGVITSFGSGTRRLLWWWQS